MWAVGTVAPWCLGAGIAVSIPAGAGQDAAIGGNIVAPHAMRSAAPANLIPSAIGDVIAPAGLFAAGRYDGLLHRARLATGDEREPFDPAPDEIEPRIKLKNHKFGFPRPDRSKKADPFIGLRPTFDAKLREKDSMRRFIAHQQMFSPDALAFAGFRTQTVDGRAEADNASPQSGVRPSATPTASSLTTGAAPGLVAMETPRHFDGSSPAVPRAVALSSTTPVDAGAQVRIVSAPMILKSAEAARQQQEQTKVARTPAKPNYLAMIARAKEPAQFRCLAQAIYFEARSEAEAGQAAVAQVVLNRVLSGLYPGSVCGVVFQNRHRYKACQFTFTCEGKSLAIREPGSWATARRIARQVLEGHTYLAKVGGSTHYHATYVRPRWAKRLKRMNKIGTHIFYKLKPGQT